MVISVKHASLTGAAADPTAMVDGPKWDEEHIVTGLENVPNVDTSNADNITGGAQTGTGAMVRATSPALVTPTLGVASATSVNKVVITPPATSATLTIPNGVT